MESVEINSTTQRTNMYGFEYKSIQTRYWFKLSDELPKINFNTN